MTINIEGGTLTMTGCDYSDRKGDTNCEGETITIEKGKLTVMGM